MDSEDLKILKMIIDELTEKASNDMSSFRYYFDDDYENLYDDDDGWTNERCKVFTISWDPKNHSHNPKAYGDVGRVSLQYRLIFQTVSISINRDTERQIFIDGGSKNKDIKISFMKLFKAIKKWEDVEVPRRSREKFINATTKVFPSIMDALILEDTDED